MNPGIIFPGAIILDRCFRFQTLDEGFGDRKRNRRHQFEPVGRETGTEKRDGNDCSFQPHDAGRPKEHVFGAHFLGSDVDGDAPLGPDILGLEEIFQHVRDTDGLCLRPDPSRRGLHRELLNQVADDFEAGASRADNDSGPEPDGLDPVGPRAQDFSRFQAAPRCSLRTARPGLRGRLGLSGNSSRTTEDGRTRR